MNFKMLFFTFSFLLYFTNLFSQQQFDYIIVSEINIEGNKKTKAWLIKRELDIAVGDTIFLNNIEKKLLVDKNKITNLDLFLHVELAFEAQIQPFAKLRISVAEQNFYYPFPVFLLADRSFNEWWYNRHHDLKRVIYGINFIHFNIGGRAEELWLNLENGFSKRAEILYKIPYLNKKMKTGLDLNLKYNTNKQLPFRTNNDKQVFESSENVLLKRFSTKIVLRRRNNFYERQRFEINFHHEILADTIVKLNPNYFLFGKSKLDYFKTSYEFEGDHRDNYIYPSKGHYFMGKLSRLSYLGREKFNLNELILSYVYYERFGKKWFGDINFRTKNTGPTLQPWAATYAFGYKNDNVRGYELYVIDGQNTALMKSNFRREIINTTIKVPSWGVWKNTKKQPLAIYGRAFYDAGYVWNKNFALNNSRLANTFIYGYGLGVDIVSIYSGALKINYSINKKNEKGLFFSFGREF
jgi:outer membrane protein assembly factor BamA